MPDHAAVHNSRKYDVPHVDVMVVSIILISVCRQP